MSIDMQKAFDAEESESRRPVQNNEVSPINIEDTNFEDLSQSGTQQPEQQNATQQQAENIPDPGY